MQRARPHPFALSQVDLEALLPGGGRGTESTLVLPSTADGPAPSPQVWGEEADDDDPQPVDRLAPWQVATRLLPPAALLDLVLDPPEVVRLAPTDSLRFFGGLARFALQLGVAGRVRAGIQVRDDRANACWQPYVGGEQERVSMRTLVESLPASARCAQDSESQPFHPEDVVSQALDAFVDAVVRPCLVSHWHGFRSVSVTDAYVRALVGSDPVLPENLPGFKALHASVHAWGREEAIGHGQGFRTCFRLCAPGEEGGDKERWALDFLLQARDDPSFLVPSQAVWDAHGSMLRWMTRNIESPQERLLADLGKASRIYTTLDVALQGDRPIGLRLSTPGAWKFLREGVPLLDQAGFGVLVPPWWKQQSSARLGLRLTARPRFGGAGELGLGALCDFRYDLALGGETISIEDLRRLAAHKIPLVQVRGKWVEIRPEDVETALAFFAKQGAGGEMSVAQALRFGLGVEEAPTGLPILDVVGEGWLGDLLTSAGDARLQPAQAPATFRGVLRPYQERGLGWLRFLDGLGLGACLADDMGLGKTIQFLALLLCDPKPVPPALPQPTLLVCPMSVVGNWQRETSRFAPSIRIHVHHGASRLDGEDFVRAARGVHLVITTFALAARDIADLRAVSWGRVVLDEAQNIKNPETRQAQAIFSLSAPRRIALTGTPVENRLEELWSIFRFLNPGLLGSAGSFRKLFAMPIEQFRDDAAAERLRRLTGPFVLRRLKTDRRVIQDLPDKIEMKVPCTLTREQATLYQAVVEDMLSNVEASEGIRRKGLVLSGLLRLKQVCNHPALFLHDHSAMAGRSGKLGRVEEILEEVLDSGEKALLFTQYAEMGEMLRAHLQVRLGREVLYLHGGSSRLAREAMLRRFEDRKGPPLFILSLRAGGTGLNLTAASHVVHFDRWWNPAVEDQATDRAFRIGQTRKVQVHKLMCAGTLEERIDRLIESKRDLANRVVGAGEEWLTELDIRQLREIVVLSGDAVAEEPS